MNKEKKKKWETPKLICLYRGRPEEAVLGNCKVATEGGPDTTCAASPQDKCKNQTAT